MIKKKSYEKLSDSNIKYVVGLLSGESPITKKEACNILNISYNTTRLNAILESYENKKTFQEKQRSKNRGKPATREELINAIEYYLDGYTYSQIAIKMFRSVPFIKNLVETAGVPEKQSKASITGYHRHTYLLPDQCVKETFEPGEVAWSSVYNSPCDILKEEENRNYEERYNSKAYSIMVFEMKEWEASLNLTPWIGVKKMGFYASSLAYNLGSLAHLKELGVNLERRFTDVFSV